MLAPFFPCARRPLAPLLLLLLLPLPPCPFASSSSSLFASNVLLLLTALPLPLATLAFVLQWRGGLDDPASRWPTDTQRFPGMENSPLGSSSAFSSLQSSSAASSDCSEILGHSSSPSFPYYRRWKFGFESDLRPKICHLTL